MASQERLSIQETEAVIDRIKRVQHEYFNEQMTEERERILMYSLGEMIMKYANQIVASLEQAAYGEND